MNHIYVITEEAWTNDMTETYTEVIGFVETEEQAKEYCEKRNADYEYRSPYSYQYAGKIDIENMED